MTTLITAPQASWEAGRKLATALRHYAGEVGEVRLDCLEAALVSKVDATSVILVHGESAEPLFDFITHCSAAPQAPPVLVWGVPVAPHLLVEYLIQGARACFADGECPERLLEAFPIIHNGGHYLPPAVQRIVLGHFVEISSRALEVQGAPYQFNDGLTEREREVLELLAKGYTNPEIADRLFLEVGTIKNHVHHILTKLNVDDRRAAARYFQTRQRFTAG